MSRPRLAGALHDVLAPSEQLDDAEREVGKPEGVGRASPDEERRQRRGIGRGRQRVAESGGDLADLLPALRGPHHAAKRREALVLQVARGDAVGRDHEVLDQLRRPVPLLLLEVDDVAVGHDRARLEHLEVERAVLVPAGRERLRDAILQPDLRIDAGCGGHRRGHGSLAVEPGPDAAVGELRLVPDARAVDVGRRDRPVVAHDKVDHHGEALLVVRQRREVGRELLGEHRKDARRRVDGRRVSAGVGVDRGVPADERVHFRNGDEHAYPATGKLLRDGELIEVARVVVVDRRPCESSEVARRCVGRGAAERVRLTERGRREVRLEAAVDHCLAGDPAEVDAACGHDRARSRSLRSTAVRVWTAYASITSRAACAGSSVRTMRSRSAGHIFPSRRTRAWSQRTRPLQ